MNAIRNNMFVMQLSSAGYISSSAGAVVQPESTKAMIVNIYQNGILLIWVAAVLVLLLYKLDNIYPQIMADLKEREALGEL